MEEVTVGEGQGETAGNLTNWSKVQREGHSRKWNLKVEKR